MKMSCSNSCAKRCKGCNDEHDRGLQEEIEKPLTNLIFELKANYERRLVENGCQFSQGLNSISTGEIEDTKENRARCAIGWIGMMLAMDHPMESEKKAMGRP